MHKRKIIIKSSKQNYSIELLNISKSNFKANIDTNDILLVDKKVFQRHKLSKFLSNKNIIKINASEKSKSFENLNSIINQIIKKNFNKNNKLIIIGGGITQDIGSFIASILFRGIDWIFYPTSFLSQCDSCIGGKTSINFYSRKNQIGNFHPPKKIFIDVNFLNTLSKKEINSGIGEMAHYFLVSGKEDVAYFKLRYQKAMQLNLKACEQLIFKSLNIKKRFIEKDEFDKKERLLLNYGHTYGHAIESITNFKIPHGIAVAHGMNMANFISHKLGLLKYEKFEMVKEILDPICKDYLPKNININHLIKALKKDKKNINSNIRSILAKDIGHMIVREIVVNDNFKKILYEFKRKYFRL